MDTIAPFLAMVAIRGLVAIRVESFGHGLTNIHRPVPEKDW